MRNSDLLEQLQHKDITYVYNLSEQNVLSSLINLKLFSFTDVKEGKPGGV